MGPAIIVINDRYLPDRRGAAACVGVTGFAHEALTALRATDPRVLLYRRVDGLSRPRLREVRRAGYAGVVLEFDFAMAPSVVSQAIRVAADSIRSGCRGTPVLYYQSDTMLSFNPEGMPAAVTHHGPFVDHFLEHFTESEAGVAFDSPAKVEHLQHHQRLGLRRLADDPSIVALTHSRLQESQLVRNGIPPRRIRPVRPPISFAAAGPGRAATPTASSTAPATVFAAVARIDLFKNLDLLVDAGVELLGRGATARIVVIGGNPGDDAPVLALRRRIPRRLRPGFTFRARLPKAELYAMFRAQRAGGVFVCSSRYETLGITSLEAAAHGVATLVARTPLVEAARHFPEASTYPAVPAALSDALHRVVGSSPATVGAGVQRHLRGRVGRREFAADLAAAWATVVGEQTAEAC